MPPKSTTAGAGKDDKKGGKPKKLKAIEIALGKAVETAGKLYKQHEAERLRMESADRVALQKISLDDAIEKERLRVDRDVHAAFLQELVEREELAYKEYEKHRFWSLIPEATRLPQIRSESAINTFLSVWREEEEHYEYYCPGVSVYIRRNTINDSSSVYRFDPGERGIPPAMRRKILRTDLDRCVEGYRLTETIRLEADRSLTQGNTEDLKFFNDNIGKVYKQMMCAFDFVTTQALLNYDVILEGPDSEFLIAGIPEPNPVVRYGLWVKVKETTRSFASLVFPSIGMRLDPKSSALPKLPKALGLSKENVAVRVIQFGFDPYSYYGSVGREYYALSCVIMVDLLNFTERPKQNGEWLYRSETQEAHALHVVPYPPPNMENMDENPSLRFSFDVPNTIVMRQSSLLMGKWVEESKEWEPCSHTTLSQDSSKMDSRTCSFVTNEFATFTILQEKGFDVPYDHWRLQPLSCDEVLVVLSGRRRSEVSDREFHIVIQDAKCKLNGPEDAELAYLRENWLEPSTLVRLLSQAGFNFSLDDADATFMENIVPKTSELEKKVYSDIAQFCLFYAIASSRHNKCGEDADLALFRISEQPFATTQGDFMSELVMENEVGWHSVRYQTHCCAFSAFEESQEVPDLRVLDGHETHFNLYTLLLKEKGEEVRLQAIHRTNFLLRRCVYQLLMLIRPLTWG
uniref:Putative chaperone protein DNAj n=1 Tax=Trypanosoma vivax (strain Y486) TaxID=1055687 RepID=G0TTU1_TRYVY|nr:putative chaperone protein DNAj [Trypanosoma vivax Y486]